VITYRSIEGQVIYDRLFECSTRMFRTGRDFDDSMLSAISCMMFNVLNEWERGTVGYGVVTPLERVADLFETMERDAKEAEKKAEETNANV